MASAQTRRPLKNFEQQSIRDTVHLLSNFLGEYGVPKVPLECFRQAKFNKSEPILSLWKLTFHSTQISQFLGVIKADFPVQSFKPSLFLSITEKNLPTVQDFVRGHMFELGYRRKEFFFMTPSVGSRELLLAFAWLLNRTSLFSMMTRHLLAVIKRTAIPLKTIHKHIVEQVLAENQRFGYDVDSVMTFFKEVDGNELSQDACIKTLHKLVWLRGCINGKWESMYRAHSAYQKSAYKIHKLTRGSTTARRPRNKTRDLSVLEVFLLRYPNQFEAYLGNLGWCLSVLQKSMQWQECEPLFWQWMESVVDLHEEEEEEKVRQGKEDMCTQTTGDDNEALLAEWRKLQEEIESLLEKNRLHAERLNTILEHKKRTLEHKEINRQEQFIKKQLQFECSLVLLPAKSTIQVVTSMLEELIAIDKPVFGIPIEHKTAQLHQVTDGEIFYSACSRMKAAVDDVEALDAAIEDRKSRIKKSLKTLEQRLPATLCKLEQSPL